MIRQGSDMSEFPVAFSIPPVLPALSLLLIAGAALIGLLAWWRGTNRGGAVTSWDIVAALAFLGCAAAILGEVEHLIDFFGAPRPQPAESANG
jgi:hypothetical protein